jgi:hypothetical protein
MHQARVGELLGARDRIRALWCSLVLVLRLHALGNSDDQQRVLHNHCDRMALVRVASVFATFGFAYFLGVRCRPDSERVVMQVRAQAFDDSRTYVLAELCRAAIEVAW